MVLKEDKINKAENEDQRERPEEKNWTA